MDLQQETDILRKVPMFSKLEPTKLKLLAFTSERMTFEAGEALFMAGDPADCAYVVLAGIVDIIAQTDAGEAVALTRGENDLIGELAILTGEPRSATIRAHGEVEAIRITDDSFLKLLSENPEVSLDVMRTLSMKLANSFRQYEDLQDQLNEFKSRVS